MVPHANVINRVVDILRIFSDLLHPLNLSIFNMWLKGIIRQPIFWRMMVSLVEECCVWPIFQWVRVLLFFWFFLFLLFIGLVSSILVCQSQRKRKKKLLVWSSIEGFKWILSYHCKDMEMIDFHLKFLSWFNFFY